MDFFLGVQLHFTIDQKILFELCCQKQCKVEEKDCGCNDAKNDKNFLFHKTPSCLLFRKFKLILAQIILLGEKSV